MNSGQLEAHLDACTQRVEAVCAGLGQHIGAVHAEKLMGEPWVADLEAWTNLVKYFRASGAPVDDVGVSLELAIPFIEEALFNAMRIIVQQEASSLSLSMTDEQRLVQLERRGLRRIRASGHDNNCLAFSILILLISHGIVQDCIPDQERIEVCDELREHLIASPELCPRDSSGEIQEDAYLHITDMRELVCSIFSCVSRIVLGR